MPTIRYKKLQIQVTVARGERILCEACQEPYTCLTRKAQTVTELGGVVFDSDERMQSDALQRCNESVKNTALERHSSRARCPRCNQYQGWMIRDNHILAAVGAVLGALVGGVVGLIGGAIVAHLFLLAAGESPLPYALGAAGLCGLAAAGFVVYAALRDEAPADATDPRSLTDEGLLELFERARREGKAPMLLWLADAESVAGKIEGTPLDLGVLDELGGIDVPAEFRVDSLFSDVQPEPQQA